MVLIFLFGLIIGSFLNVVIFRLNTGRLALGLSKGRRSKCLHCGKTLHWYELIPVVSFFIQQARCRGCKSKLAWQYPLVELATAILFLTIWRAAWPLSLTLAQLIIWSLLVVIFVYDWRHQIIPDSLVYAFVVLAVLAAWLSSANLLSHLLAGLGLAAFFWLLWLISRGRWMGFGDGKLALGVGLLAGPSGGASALVLAFWLGALVGVALLFHARRSRAPGKSYTMKSALPFAPFIIIGLALVQFFNLNVVSFFQV